MVAKPDSMKTKYVDFDSLVHEAILFKVEFVSFVKNYAFGVDNKTSESRITTFWFWAYINKEILYKNQWKSLNKSRKS